MFDLIEWIDDDTFDRLAPDPPPTGVIAIAQRPPVNGEGLLRAADPAPVVLLERPNHFGNIGAAIRVAAAAGAAGVLTTGSRDPWHPAALRGSAGLHFALPVGRIDRITPGDRQLVALDPAGTSIEQFEIPDRALLAFGSERHGLSETLRQSADSLLAIPMRPGVSSLNLATSVAVVLSRWSTGHSE